MLTLTSVQIKISDIAKFLESPGKLKKNPATFPGLSNNKLWLKFIHITCNLCMEFLLKQSQPNYIPH